MSAENEVRQFIVAPTTTASGSIAGSSGICPTPASTSSRAGRAPASSASTARAPTPGDRLARARRSACPRPSRSSAAAKPQARSPAAQRRPDRLHARDGDPPGCRRRSCSTSRPASRRRAAPRPSSMSTACSTRSSSSRGAAQAGPPARQGYVGRAAARPHRARRRLLLQASFSGRTAKKIYWALVMGVPEIEDGIIDLPIAKQPGTGGEKMHVDEGRRAQPHPLPRDRAGRQPHRLGRAPAALPAAPTSCASIWRRSATRSSATANTGCRKRS
jgi:hypothetical protein